MIDRATQLIHDLERLPAVLRALASQPYPAALGPRPRHVVLTGLGSSRFAALLIEPLLRDAGIEIVVEHASTDHPAPVGRGSLLIGISSSGSTPETIGAVERAHAAGASTVAVTNREDSPLARAAQAVLLLGAGTETSGVSALTFGATVGVLAGLAASLGAWPDAAGSIRRGASAVADLVATRDRWLGPAADCLDGGGPVHVLGGAELLGAAEQVALLLRECPRLEAHATEAGDWLHVGIYTALPGSRALIIGRTAYEARLISTFHERGGRVLSVALTRPRGADASVLLPGLEAEDPIAFAIVASTIGALLAAELWLRATARDAPA